MNRGLKIMVRLISFKCHFEFSLTDGQSIPVLAQANLNITVLDKDTTPCILKKEKERELHLKMSSTIALYPSPSVRLSKPD